MILLCLDGTVTKPWRAQKLLVIPDNVETWDRHIVASMVSVSSRSDWWLVSVPCTPLDSSILSLIWSNKTVVYTRINFASLRIKLQDKLLGFLKCGIRDIANNHQTWFAPTLSIQVKPKMTVWTMIGITEELQCIRSPMVDFNAIIRSLGCFHLQQHPQKKIFKPSLLRLTWSSVISFWQHLGHLEILSIQSDGNPRSWRYTISFFLIWENKRHITLKKKQKRTGTYWSGSRSVTWK